MFLSAKEAPFSEKRPRWRVFAQFSENNFLMCKTEDSVVRYAPLCIHTFRLIAPRKLQEAQIFTQQYHSYEEIDNVPDRLRWCRHHMGLMQKEVAEFLGITREKYLDYETGSVAHYSKDILDKLAVLYRVPVEELLDDYNRFLYMGQGKLIREYRESLGMKKKEFARMLNLGPGILHLWETDQKRMYKESWEKYFKDVIM